MEIKTIMVVGAGQMGSGIAQVAAQNGYKVQLNDISQDRVDKGLAGISAGLVRMVKKEKISPEEKAGVMDRIQPAVELAPAAECDLVIEAAIEKIEIKAEIFKKL